MASAEQEDLDDIPPLEDIPNLDVTKINEVKSAKITKTIPITDSNTKTNDQVTIKQNVEKKESNLFGGFKKGFLNSKPTKNNNDDGLVYVKSNPNKTTDLRINEDIKSSLQDSGMNSSKAWLTDDLIDQIDKNEVLRKGFTNNRLLDKISKFQQNPQAALKECENDMEAQLFLKEYLKIMGNHLTTNEFNVKTRTNEMQTQIKPVEDPEQKKVNELMKNENVRSLLMDKDVQNLFLLLKNNPENSHRILQNANKEMQIKIQKLISYGLLGVKS